ncbi:MAG: hypothetical protein XD42_1267, partial [Thermodesulfobacterium sp. 37_54]
GQDMEKKKLELLQKKKKSIHNFLDTMKIFEITQIRRKKFVNSKN